MQPPRQRFPKLCSKCGLSNFLPTIVECPCTDIGFHPEDMKSYLDIPLSEDENKLVEQSMLKIDVYNVGSVTQRSGLNERGENVVLRCVHISDTHCRHRSLDIPDGDVLIHSGDITFSGREEWLIDFNDWLGSLPHRYKIVIAGNHDVTLHSKFYRDHHWRFHEDRYDVDAMSSVLTNCIYLQDESVVIEGITFYGTPWVPAFHDWAFNLYKEEELEIVYSNIPLGTDVLITHSPPARHRSKTSDGTDIGSRALAERVKVVKPAVHVFGHLHYSYGKDITPNTTFLNGASVNSKYKAVNRPIIFDITNDSSQ